MTLCVYGIVGRGVTRTGIRGLAGEPLRVVPAGRVGAVVGVLDRVPRPTEATLRAFDAVVRRLAQRMPALLPARFATCVEGFDELALAMTARERSLRDRLRLARHRAQMTVRIVTTSRAGNPAPDRTGRRSRDRETPGSTRRSPGARYLRTRARDLARESSVPALAPITRAVRRWVRAERVETRGAVATVYHLVPRSTAGRYRRAVERAARGAGLRSVVTGPWPAYAFAAHW